METTGVFLIILAVIIFLIAVFGKSSPQRPIQSQQPQRHSLTDAEKEIIRQADEVWDWQTHNAVVNGTYNGPIPEHIVGDLWTELYPDIYTTKIAGINFRKGIKNTADTYCDCSLVEDPKNRHDPNAIKVIHSDGRHIGFIPAEYTDVVRKFINSQFPYTNVRARIVGREEENYYTEHTRHYLDGELCIYKPGTTPEDSIPIKPITPPPSDQSNERSTDLPF